MVSKLSLVQGICRMVGVTRKRPQSKALSKKELHAVFAKLNLLEQEKLMAEPAERRKRGS